MSNTTLEMDDVAVCLTESAKHGLQVEVVTWALKEMKANPNLEIGEAINAGLNEWVK